jgi:hypothetical protein
MNNLCLGWSCDHRETCQKYIPNAVLEEGYTRYFLPLSTGEHCESFSKIRDLPKDCPSV